MSECLSDCWICKRDKLKCSLINQCAVFDGAECKMRDACNPKRKKCPLNNKQMELLNE
jgi:hypothetical protein